MAHIKNRCRLIISISLVVFGLIAFSGCSQLGRKYTAFQVTSEPPGASVDSLIDNKISGKFANAVLGVTPTEVKVVYYAFGAPFVGDTKIGIRIYMPGYETKELFFGTGDWYGTRQEARKHTRKISVALKKKQNGK